MIGMGGEHVNMRNYKIGLYEKAMPETLSWKEKLLAAKEAGFDYVEMSIDATEDKICRIHMSKEDRLQLVSLMYETGMPIRSMCVSALTKYSLGNENPDYVSRGMEILEKAIELAEDLGVRAIMIPGYDVYYEPSSLETKKRYLENLKKASRMAEKAGVLLGLETMENEFMNTVEKAMKYVTLCDSEYVKIYPDIGNTTNAAMRYKTDVLEDLELGKGNMIAMHLKETLPGRYREVPYGEGHVNFEAVIRKAWQLNVRRFVAEFWYQGSREWKADLMDANHRMTAILDLQT